MPCDVGFDADGKLTYLVMDFLVLEGAIFTG